MGGNSGSRASTEPSGLGPTGFDPGRLRELAERCEQAKGPDEALDREISEEIYPGDKDMARAFRPTKSLDSAILMVPLGIYPDLCRSFQGFWTSNCYDYERAINNRAEAMLPTLALCAAALRARAIEAGTATTPKIGVVHESASANGGLPKE